MEILIAGDYCPQNRISQLIEKNDFESVFGEIRDIVLKADYSIVNLECPITKGTEKPIKKCGPSLQSSEKGIEALKWVGFQCVTLANNHILDYGTVGLSEAKKSCERNGLDTVGGGVNSVEASQVLYKTIRDESIAIINCCEHEFSIAKEDEAGSNPLNPIRQYSDIVEAQKKADYVIVIVHGGNEYYQLPSPRMKETYRFFIDAGADAVVNHHQHCYSGYEIYKEKPIVYGLGNFCFDDPCLVDDNWNKGYIVKIHLQDKVRIELIPYNQCGSEPKVRLLDSKEDKVFENEITRLNSIISDDKLLNDRYSSFLKNSESIMRILFSPYTSKITKGLCRRHLLPNFVTSKKKLELLSYIQCESHLSKVIQYLSSK